MGYQDRILRNFHNAFGHFMKLGGCSQHLIVDPGEVYHKGLNFAFRVYQAYKLVYHLLAIKTVDGYFGYSFFIVFSPSCLYIENRIHVHHFFVRIGRPCFNHSFWHQRYYFLCVPWYFLLQWQHDSHCSSPWIGFAGPAVVPSNGHK